MRYVETFEVDGASAVFPAAPPGRYFDSRRPGLRRARGKRQFQHVLDDHRPPAPPPVVDYDDRAARHHHYYHHHQGVGAEDHRPHDGGPQIW